MQKQQSRLANLNEEEKRLLNEKVIKIIRNNDLTESHKVREFIQVLPLSKRATNGLYQSWFSGHKFPTSIENLVSSPIDEYKLIKNIGPKTALEIHEVLEYFKPTVLKEIAKTEPLLQSHVDMVEKRLDTALEMLRKRNVQDTSGMALAQLLRQLFDEPKKG